MSASKMPFELHGKLGGGGLYLTKMKVLLRSWDCSFANEDGSMMREKAGRGDEVKNWANV